MRGGEIFLAGGFWEPGDEGAGAALVVAVGLAAGGEGAGFGGGDAGDFYEEK